MTIAQSLLFEKMENILPLWDIEAHKECRNGSWAREFRRHGGLSQLSQRARARLPEQERATNTGRMDPDQA